jgi:dipeptidyl aminopeptidase/acylaminoacyl peptidase
MATFGSGMDDAIGPPQAEWSSDSKAVYATRIDARGVQDLFLINSLATPRPTLEKYKYPMPGEDAIRKTELYVCEPSSRKLTRVKPKWKDESYSDIHWGKTPGELRFIRRDRLYRNAELCSYDVKTGEAKCLLAEGFEAASLELMPVRYLNESDEMIWWSERTGWGHFYLYSRDGKLKNAITSGDYRASQIVAIDPNSRTMWFIANGREAGENVYYQHLYRVKLDGTGLTLLDPGNAHHFSTLSPSREFLVDNCSRIDQVPVSVLRDARGQKVMDLEKADLSRLIEFGWKMPSTFTVKAADGVTELYGNMWKPFDFDPKKKYPIIANVYPGPQTEGVTHTFLPISPQQQLAQLGFIVIQVGHRGGTPTRSKAYHAFGYYNLRDYGLADKKAAIEQLAARHSFIDINKVGIYGHSGGGFMSAAAVLQKPYNEFFKAAVATAGNHDNNVYGHYWAERYHGLKEVVVKKDEKKAAQGDSKSASDKSTQGHKETQTETRFEIKVPTNAELAANLKGALLLVHGDLDNNVHPAGTMRLVSALIKANKRFELLILPGARHAFGEYTPYVQQKTWDFFVDHLLGERHRSADIREKDGGNR